LNRETSLYLDIVRATFTFYLFHLPVAQFLTTIVPWPPNAWATRIVMFPGTLAIVFLIASVTERRKEMWRKGIGALARPLAYDAP
jgi:peptidoglycan/LPS O-acetylase OafA/YrhL